MAIHNSAKDGEIAKTVLMPGDPLRAKYIAEKFLNNYRLVSDVRNIYAYTGKYKGKEITIMASGMGMPSIGIYCYELYKFYNVEKIIRIGSCGAYSPEIKLLDTILVNGSYTEGNFAYNMNNEKCNFVYGDKLLSDNIEESAKSLNINLVKANVACTECFDAYTPNPQQYVERLPKEYNIVASEMESFALFYTAKVLNKKAACLLTVVDSNYKDIENKQLTSEERELSLNNMIEVALEAAIK